MDAHRILAIVAACLAMFTSAAPARQPTDTPQPAAPAQPQPPAPIDLTLAPDATELVFDHGLVVPNDSDFARRAIKVDPMIAAIVNGSLNLAAVNAGDEFQPGHTWADIAAKDGSFNPSGRADCILIRVRSAAPRVMLLDAAGHALVYVNGQPRMGDPYGHGYLTLPVHLNAGVNTFLFAHAGRGGMRAALRKPGADLLIVDRDLTLPDARPDAPLDGFIGVPVMNATAVARTIVVHAAAGSDNTQSQPTPLAPYSVVKVAVPVTAAPSTQPVPVRLSVHEGDTELAHFDATLNSPPVGAPYKITFLSRIDGSAQYVAVLPPPAGDSAPSPGLVLSLHGASVEATGQASSYAARPGYVIACPTNRRPYGFDWEDWGRIDALESMDLIKARFHTDPARQYLTGHSMGGHGTWNIGVLYPDRFAAIAPSAGWLSFDTYMSGAAARRTGDDPLAVAFDTARAGSNTLHYFPNLRTKGIYILHGDKDDNVPVEQARMARAALEALDIPFEFHEQPGAGHWWDDDKPGAACLDWPGIWATFDAHRLDVAPSTPPPVTPPLDDRGFNRGSFKRAFDHEFMLVYATSGSPEENEWSLAKARYDAEQWWYRGNGRAIVISDDQLITDLKSARAADNHNLILYGNADTNAAWSFVVHANSPLTLTRETATLRGAKTGAANLETKSLSGDDIAVLAVLPRRAAANLVVGVVGGTGLKGCRATERFSYFSSGAGFPEVIAARARVWRDGMSAVEAAGPATGVVWR